METTSNKEVILHFYNEVLNNRNFDQLDGIVSDDYVSQRGERGKDAFRKGVAHLIEAFPDVKWTLADVVSEGEKVVVRQRMDGTHLGTFQGIEATNRRIAIEGFAIYELADGRIIGHQIETDRLSFFQQLGVLPPDPALTSRGSRVHLVDNFEIPEGKLGAFTDRLNYSRNLIRTIPGFVRDEIISGEVEGGGLTVLSVTTWQSREHFENARSRVQEEYTKIGFDPAEFTARHGIRMKRQILGDFVPTVEV